MGGFAKRLIGGLATGAGNMLVAKGAADAQAKREELLMQRELALKALDKRDRMEVATFDNKLRVDGQKQIIAAQGVENRLGNAQEVAGRKTLQDDQQAHNLTVTQIEVKNRNFLAKLGHQHRMTEQQASDVRQFANEAQQANTYIDKTEVLADGRMLVWTKNGNSKVIGDAGSFVVPGKGGEADGGSIDSLRPGGAKPAPAAGAKPKADDATYTRATNALAAAYANATPQSHPSFFANGKKRPMEELKAEIARATGRA